MATRALHMDTLSFMVMEDSEVEEYYSQIFFHASLEGVRNTGAAKHWSCVTRMHLTV